MHTWNYMLRSQNPNISVYIKCEVQGSNLRESKVAPIFCGFIQKVAGSIPYYVIDFFQFT
jgi:hypothetical protein